MSRYGNPDASTGNVVPRERLVVTIPIRTTNPLNRRKSYWAVSKQGRADKSATLLVLRSVYVGPFPLPVAVALTRISPGTGLDGHDALPASLKHVVDAIAYWLGVDDADTEAVTWRYAQERGSWGVRVVVEAVNAPR